jgi:hypothetical protein
MNFMIKISNVFMLSIFKNQLYFIRIISKTILLKRKLKAVRTILYFVQASMSFFISILVYILCFPYTRFNTTFTSFFLFCFQTGRKSQSVRWLRESIVVGFCSFIYLLNKNWIFTRFLFSQKKKYEKNRIR